MRKLLSFLYICYFFISSGVLVWIAAAITLFTKDKDPNRRLTHRFGCWWANHYITMNPLWKVKWEGVDYIPDDKPVIIAPNHQSYWDIMLLYGLYKPYKWVSKEEIFKVPFIGWNMELNQYVKLARGDRKSIKEMMATCRKWLEQGSSLLLFPEGTRSPDGEIKEFTSGAFKLATDCNVPVIPVVVDGTHLLYPKGSNIISFKGNLTVHVLPPVYPKNFETVRQMRDFVRDKMVAELNAIRGRIASDDTSKSKSKAAEKELSSDDSSTISTAKTASETELKSI